MSARSVAHIKYLYYQLVLISYYKYNFTYTKYNTIFLVIYKCI